MKKNRMLAGALGIVMMGAMALPAGAASTGDDPKMEIKYSQESTWEVTIPATTLSATAETIQTVQATQVDIRPDQKLQVKITGIQNGIVTLTRTDGETTTSTVSKTDGAGTTPINSNTVIAEFENQDTDCVNGTDGRLYFSPIAQGTKAGDYTGTITYVMQTVSK